MSSAEVQGVDLTCPCGPFRPGDPSDFHSQCHSAWLVINKDRDAESTSATLRRVGQERDEAVANFKRLQVLAREDFEKCTAVIKQTGDDRDLARAELASARTELDAVRPARDRLDREATRLRNQLLQLTQVPGEPTGGVLDSWVRYLCETCSARYSINFPDHEHGPLTPVLVTLTRLTEEH